jgi:iron(III) transport system permease protein
MFAVSFLSPDGTLTLSNYTRLLGEQRQRELLLTTITLGAAAAAVATVVGVLLGFLLARVDLPHVALLRLALLVPLVIPPYVLALVWIFLTGYSEISYSLPAAAVVLGVGFYPLSMLAAEAAFRRVEASLEEAAQLITNPLTVFARITLPLVAPLIAAAGLLVFALSVAEFGVPGLLRVRVFSTEVFTAFAALYDFGRATASAVPLLAITLIAAIMARWAIGQRLLTPGATLRPSILSVRPVVKTFEVVLVVVFVGTVVGLPVATLIGQGTSLTGSIDSSWPAIRLSIALSIIAATAIVIIGVMLGYARARMLRGGTVADLVLIAVFAIPSTVVGIGLIGVWNRPSVPIEFYASSMMIVLGYIARFLPVAVLIVAASVRQVSPASEEAAEICGVSWAKAFWRVVLPQIRGGIVAAWIAVFVFTFGELGATILVSPPGQFTLPVRVYTLIANAPQSQIAGLALLQVVAAIVPLALFALTFGRAERNQ